MWPYLYAMAFGLTGAFYAKKLKKNPYIWFAVGCIWKFKGLLLMFLPLAISAVSIYFLRKRSLNRFARDLEEARTVDAVPVFTLKVSKEAMSAFWYYLKENGTNAGPMSFQALENALKKGEVRRETFVWNETFEEWKLIKDLL